ncbi:hypothetical protein ACLOJK_009691 [Asimina triloba]
MIGTIGLLICMLGGVLYQQSTTKPKAAVEKIGGEEEQKLLEMESPSEVNTPDKPVGAGETSRVV